jgi:hypothetical protein
MSHGTMFADQEQRIARYHCLYSEQKPSLLVHIRCHEAAVSKHAHPGPLSAYDFTTESGTNTWIEDICREVIIENAYHPLADDYLPSRKIVGDPNVPNPVDEIDRILERVGLKPLLITASPEKIISNLPSLSRGRIVLRTDVQSIDEGKEILDLVRKYTRQ